MFEAVAHNGFFEKIKLIFCEKFDQSSSLWNLSEHRHNFLEMIYFLEGSAIIHGRKDNLKLSTSDLLIYPPNVFHREQIDLNNNIEVIRLAFSISLPLNLEHIVMVNDLQRRLVWIFEEIYSQYESNLEMRLASLDALIKLLFLNLFDYFKSEPYITDPINRVLGYIKKNYEKKISIEDLAHLANYSESYFIRRFKKYTDLSPVDYINYIRLKQSAKLLGRFDLSITAISEMIGFNDQKYFSKKFIEHYGISPSQYRSNLYNVENVDLEKKT